MDEAFVGISEISVSPEGGPHLEQAFRQRMGAVEAWPGFIRLSVLRDRRMSGRYVMVSEWTDHASFLAYMRSADHRESHGRITKGDMQPRAVRFDGYDCVSR